jgi:hypothetical protein
VNADDRAARARGNGVDLGYRPPHNLFEAARRHYTIRITCKACKHTRVFDAHALWWLFQRRHWDGYLNQVGRHFFCLKCLSAGKKVKLPRVEPVKDEPDGPQPPMPSEGDWKREIRRVRS